METFHPLCSKLKELLTNKQLAATISIAWILLHLTAGLPSQFIQLRTYCHEHMHWVDLIGILATARLLLALLIALLHKPYNILKQTARIAWLRHLAKKEIKRILQTPHSEDYTLLTLLYNEPDTPLNPYAPLTIVLHSAAVIKPTCNITTHPPGASTYLLPYQLTHFARQYMETHRNRGTIRRSKHIRSLLFLARCLKARNTRAKHNANRPDKQK